VGFEFATIKNTYIMDKRIGDMLRLYNDKNATSEEERRTIAVKLVDLYISKGVVDDKKKQNEERRIMIDNEERVVTFVELYVLFNNQRKVYRKLQIKYIESLENIEKHRLDIFYLKIVMSIMGGVLLAMLLIKLFK